MNKKDLGEAICLSKEDLIYKSYAAFQFLKKLDISTSFHNKYICNVLKTDKNKEQDICPIFGWKYSDMESIKNWFANENTTPKEVWRNLNKLYSHPDRVQFNFDENYLEIYFDGSEGKQCLHVPVEEIPLKYLESMYDNLHGSSLVVAKKLAQEELITMLANEKLKHYGII